MARRSNEQIEKDYREIKSLVLTNPNFRSLDEISNVLGLSLVQVKKSLERHPRVCARIVKKLNANCEKLEATQKQVQAPVVQTVKAIVETEPKVKNKVQKIIIDASVCGSHQLWETIDDFLAKASKIILTSLTIIELERLKTHPNLDGQDARKLIAKGTEEPQNFVVVNIQKENPNPDDDILHFAQINRFMLLTSDNAMALKAKALGIHGILLKKEKKDTATIKPTFFKDGKLCMFLESNQYRKMQVIRDNILFTNGVLPLEVDDEVYIAVNKTAYISIVVFKVINTEEYDNVICIFSKRIYQNYQLEAITDKTYRSFLKDFISNRANY